MEPEGKGSSGVEWFGIDRIEVAVKEVI